MTLFRKRPTDTFLENTMKVTRFRKRLITVQIIGPFLCFLFFVAAFYSNQPIIRNISDHENPIKQTYFSWKFGTLCVHISRAVKNQREDTWKIKIFLLVEPTKRGLRSAKTLVKPLGFLISLKIKFQNVYTDNHKVPKIHSYKIFGGPGGSKLENYILKNCWVCAQRYLDIIWSKWTKKWGLDLKLNILTLKNKFSHESFEMFENCWILCNT